jgi:Bacterial SH3 domain
LKVGNRISLFLVFIVIFSGTSKGLPRPKDQPLGPGITREFPASMEDLLQALHDVLGDQTIHGTQIYDKQPVLMGATEVQATPLFEAWPASGKVFYKIRKDAIAPRHFLESADQGTIAVRYIVTSISAERIRLHIDAVYVENTHRTVHISDGTVETSESKVIEDRLHAIQSDEQEAAEANRRRESAELVRKTEIREKEDEAKLLSAAQSSTEGLQQQIVTLRHEVERRVRAPGAKLRSAPFASSAITTTLSAYAEVVIVIVTPHWYGVETTDGQRGWMRNDELDHLP